MEWFISLLAFAAAGLASYSLFLLLGSAPSALKGYQKGHRREHNESLADRLLFLTPQQFRIFQGAAVAALFLLLFLLLGFTAALLLCPLGFFVPTFVMRTLRRRRRRDFEARLPDVLTTLSSSLRAGFTLSQAFDLIVKEYPPPASQEFSIVLHENRLGVPLDDAIQNLAKRVGSQDLELVVTAAIIARSLGGNLAEVFDRIESTIRRRARVEGKIKALTAQGKMQGFVVGLAPFLLGGILYLMNPAFVMPLFTHPLGQVALVTMLLMEVMGGLLIRKIVTIEF